MQHKIYGDNLEVVAIRLRGDEEVYGEAGSMIYMTPNIEMETEASGGFMKSLKRKFTGESFFVTQFGVKRDEGIVAFSGNAPGRIKSLRVTPDQEYLAQKDSFLCAQKGVDLDIAFQKDLGGGLFGGEGFMLQKFSGSGAAFIHVIGDVIERRLSHDESLKVSTGNVVAWEKSVEFDIQSTGGIKSSLFSGEGLFMTTLTGPGKVWIQSMTLPELAGSLSPYISQESSG